MAREQCGAVWGVCYLRHKVKTAALDFLSLDRLINNTILQKALRESFPGQTCSEALPRKQSNTHLCSAPLSTQGWDLLVLHKGKQLVV